MMSSNKKNQLPTSEKDKIKNIQLIAPWAKKTMRPGVMTNIGGFAGLFKTPGEYKQPILVSASESAGEKLQLAMEFGYAEAAAGDIASMCFNHIAALGGKPLYFMDNIAFHQWNEELLQQIISGISFSCMKSQCALLGGDTSVVPDIVQKKGGFHVNGFCVGVVEKEKIINPGNIKEGDIIVGLPSSGIHTAGSKQMMHILKDILKLKADKNYMLGNKNMIELMMQPVRSYSGIMEKLSEKIIISGAVHITEGGLLENIPRIMPNQLSVYIEKYNIIPEIFKIIIEEDILEYSELYKYFNMGIGMLLFISPENYLLAETCFEANNEPYIKMGEVKKSNKMTIEYLL